MFRIEFIGIWVEHIIIDNHLIPSSDEVDIDIVSNLQIPVHAKETGQGTIRRIMKRDAIQAIDRSIAEKILILARGKIDRGEKSWG
jgi:hypothetical protein